jgi:hypothetical protein
MQIPMGETNGRQEPVKLEAWELMECQVLNRTVSTQLQKMQPHSHLGPVSRDFFQE